MDIGSQLYPKSPRRNFLDYYHMGTRPQKLQYQTVGNMYLVDNPRVMVVAVG